MEVETPTMENKILYVRLPCNPIFPIGVVYLADHVHKLFENVEQRIFDLGTVPPLDYKSALDACIDEFKPTLLIYSWRDIHIFAPVGGRGGNPLQYSFEIFYAKNPFVKLHGALGGVQMLKGFYTELWRNEALVKRGLKRARRYNKDVRVVIGGRNNTTGALDSRRTDSS